VSANSLGGSSILPANSKRRVTPSAWLVEAVKGTKPGKALDLGMGEGRNSLYLAAQGWVVTGVDLSDFAVTVARQQAQQSGVAYTALAADLDTWDFGQQRWDLVVSMWEPDVAWAKKIVGSLKPDGLLVREAGLGSMDEDALRKVFVPLRVLRWEVRIENTNDFKASGWGSKVSLTVARMIAQKP
jgi:SAM-dependent methyltransferase